MSLKHESVEEEQIHQVNSAAGSHLQPRQSPWTAKSEIDSDCCVGRHISVLNRGKRAVAEHLRSVAVSWSEKKKKNQLRNGKWKMEKGKQISSRADGSQSPQNTPVTYTCIYTHTYTSIRIMGNLFIGK
eukprot:GHVU01191112.1.p1 GENE.GHVU01191112.1~~GHVU01191112.1.p1  ORF type:complete len:129 (-),score=5.87 GHVU01191112.1:128-514(-)